MKYVAGHLANKSSNEVLTMGFEDTRKATGYRVFDVKTTHATISSYGHERKTLTTGFTTNISRKGVDQAKTLNRELKILAT